MRRIGLAVVLASSLLLAALSIEAQQPGKAIRIGILYFFGAAEPSAQEIAFQRTFRETLRELAGVEEQNVAFEVRRAEGRRERLPALADELVHLKVDVILAPTDPEIAAAQKATASLPVVMVSATDPVASGFVASLARPGGNITGLTVQTPDVAGKRLQLLKEAIPNLAKVAVLWDPGHTNGRQQVSEAQAAARTLGVQLQLVEMRGPGKIDAAFAAISKDRAGAAFIIGSSMPFAYRARIAELAATHHLPMVCPIREYVEAGCLMVYGASISDQWRRAAYFVDRIRKGGKPADLPVEQPTKFYLVINLKTAKALGLTIPQSLLVRADEVIQ
jgi:ABC-type uncharacterized transport system substrate-binding protein